MMKTMKTMKYISPMAVLVNFVGTEFLTASTTVTYEDDPYEPVPDGWKGMI